MDTGMTRYNRGGGIVLRTQEIRNKRKEEGIQTWWGAAASFRRSMMDRDRKPDFCPHSLRVKEQK